MFAKVAEGKCFASCSIRNHVQWVGHDAPRSPQLSIIVNATAFMAAGVKVCVYSAFRDIWLFREPIHAGKASHQHPITQMLQLSNVFQFWNEHVAPIKCCASCLVACCFCSCLVNNQYRGSLWTTKDIAAIRKCVAFCATCKVASNG